MDKNNDSVVILSAARTPVASFQGAFSNFAAPQLGAVAIKEAVKRAGIQAGDVEECVMGEV